MSKEYPIPNKNKEREYLWTPKAVTTETWTSERIEHMYPDGKGSKAARRHQAEYSYNGRVEV